MAQKFDNQAVNKAKQKVTDLVKQGYRLNPDQASAHYNEAVARGSKSTKERARSKRVLQDRAMRGDYK